MAKLSLDDHLHLTSVCRHYHRAKSFNLSSPLPSSPWLILPGRSSTTLKFLPQAKTTPYEAITPSPFIRRRLFIGSSNGWVVTVSCNPSLDLHLLNPLTGTQHPLPPIHTLPFITPIPNKPNSSSVHYRITNYKTFDHHSFIHYFFTKAVISTKDFTVLLAHPNHNNATLSYTHPDRSKWVSFVIPGHYHDAVDVIHDKGLFYAITSVGDIIICGPSSTTRVLSFQDPQFMDVEDPSSTRYIVRSVHGDLLLVHRRIEISADKDYNELLKFKTRKFMVYRIDGHKNNDQRYWKRVNDLGEQCLFLGTNESMAFSALKYPELQRNCIYFTESRTQNKSVRCRQPKQCDLGVFNLSDKSIKPLFYPSDLTWPPPIWFTPHIEGSHQ
ncbi:F-box protein SKIP23-like [Dioscorea cayenensis subsp. rotundata]|uniref:F-box protein SKIP23-like n=1 Tax=Dioscorea cayennensis subsp. rotundata TaxID=55577 RepID=A0AB40CRC3_DIOCR|nr:F-box protein SKIP23-like [Dioscorea cayenensis subsp. rotundata]